MSDPIDELFARAIMDGTCDDVADQWWPLELLDHHLYGQPDLLYGQPDHRGPGDKFVAGLVLDSLQALDQHREVAGLTVREYERLVLAIEQLGNAVVQLDEALRPVRRNTGRIP